MPEKKKMGRPRVDTESINLRLSRKAIEVLDNRRRDEPDLPTRPEMIRRLLMVALKLDETNDR